MVVQSGSPYSTPDAYWRTVSTVASVGLGVTPYHAYVPASGTGDTFSRRTDRPDLALSPSAPPRRSSTTRPSLRRRSSRSTGPGATSSRRPSTGRGSSTTCGVGSSGRAPARSRDGRIDRNTVVSSSPAELPGPPPARRDSSSDTSPTALSVIPDACTPWPVSGSRQWLWRSAPTRTATLRCHAHRDPGGRDRCAGRARRAQRQARGLGGADGSDGRGDVDGPRRHITRRHGAHDGPAPRRRRSGIRTGAPAVAVRAGSECPRRRRVGARQPRIRRGEHLRRHRRRALLGRGRGVPGLLAYRASNTLDAMIGYRNDSTAASAGPRRAGTTW